MPISATAAPLMERTLLTVEALGAAGSRRCVIARMADFLQEFGISAFGLTRQTRLPGAEPDILLDAWPEGWSAHYYGAGFYRHDPVVRHALQARDVFAWDEVPGGYASDPRAAAIPNDAAGFDIHEGLCVPLPSALGVGSLWLAGARLEQAPGLRQALRLLAHHVFQTLETLPPVPAEGASALTVRECDVLAWIAGGKTTRDVAAIMGISEHTVGEHLKNIRRKLGTSNNTHSTVRALQLGLLRL